MGRKNNNRKGSTVWKDIMKLGKEREQDQKTFCGEFKILGGGWKQDSFLEGPLAKGLIFELQNSQDFLYCLIAKMLFFILNVISSNENGEVGVFLLEGSEGIWKSNGKHHLTRDTKNEKIRKFGYNIPMGFFGAKVYSSFLSLSLVDFPSKIIRCPSAPAIVNAGQPCPIRQTLDKLWSQMIKCHSLLSGPYYLVLLLVLFWGLFFLSILFLNID